jgi:hypothetical protein
LPLLPFADRDALAALRAGAREWAIEGLMLKRGWDKPAAEADRLETL